MNRSFSMTIATAMCVFFFLFFLNVAHAVSYHNSLDKTIQFVKQHQQQQQQQEEGGGGDVNNNNNNNIQLPELMHHFKSNFQMEKKLEEQQLLVVPSSPAGPVADATCGSCIYFVNQLRNLGTLLKSTVFAWFIHDTCDFLTQTNGHDSMSEEFCDLAAIATFLTTAEFLQSKFDVCTFCVSLQIGPISLPAPGPCAMWSVSGLYPVQCGFFDLTCCPNSRGVCIQGQATCSPPPTVVCLTDPAVAAIAPDETPPAVDPNALDGWYFKNTGSPNKINWYFYARDATPVENQLTYGGLAGSWYLIHVYSATDTFIISVYTEVQGDPNTDANWYRQRVNYNGDLSAYAGQTVVLYIGQAPTLDRLAAYPKVAAVVSANTCAGTSGNGCNDKGGGGSKWIVDPATEPGNKIFLLGLGTNSGATAGEYEFTVIETGIIESNVPQDGGPAYELTANC